MARTSAPAPFIAAGTAALVGLLYLVASGLRPVEVEPGFACVRWADGGTAPHGAKVLRATAAYLPATAAKFLFGADAGETFAAVEVQVPPSQAGAQGARGWRGALPAPYGITLGGAESYVAKEAARPECELAVWLPGTSEATFECWCGPGCALELPDGGLLPYRGLPLRPHGTWGVSQPDGGIRVLPAQALRVLEPSACASTPCFFHKQRKLRPEVCQ